MQTRQILTGNSERPVHNFSEKQILRYLWRIGNQYEARTLPNRFPSSVVSTRHFQARLEADSWVEMSNGTENSRNFQISGKVDRNFRNEFLEISCSI